MKWYWWVWAVFAFWLLFSCGDPETAVAGSPIYVNVEEKPSYPKVGSGSERDSSTGVRAVDTPSASPKRRERNSEDNGRD